MSRAATVQVCVRAIACQIKADSETPTASAFARHSASPAWLMGPGRLLLEPWGLRAGRGKSRGGRGNLPRAVEVRRGRRPSPVLLHYNR